jgi:hypothetical protein
MNEQREQHFPSYLPLLGHNLLPSDKEDEIRQHVTTCASCQADLRSYQMLDEGLRRIYAGSPSLAPTVADVLHFVDLHEAETSDTNSTVVPVAATRKWFSSVIAGIVVVTLLAAFGGLLWHRAQSGSGSGHSVPFTTFTIGGALMTDDQNGWAYGSYVTHVATGTDKTVPVLFREQNGKWSRVSFPHSTTTCGDPWTLPNVSGIQLADDCQHYWRYGTNGWIATSIPSTINGSIVELNAFFAANDIWAVSNKTIFHYDGTQWNPQTLPLPTGMNLTTLHMVSPQEGWAIIGPAKQDNPALDFTYSIMHFQHQQWSVAHTFTNVILGRITTNQNGSVWVTGLSSNEGQGPVVFHLNAGSWSMVDTTPFTQAMPIKSVDMITLVFSSSDTDVWLVFAIGPDFASLWHYDGVQWKSITVPTNLRPSTNAFCIVRPNDVWLANGVGLVHYKDGTWSSIQISA